MERSVIVTHENKTLGHPPINLNIACSRMSQLLFILSIALVAVRVASALKTALPSTPTSAPLRVTVTNVRRATPGLVEVYVAIANKAQCEVYLPSDNLRKSQEIHTLEVFHWSPKAGWLPIGPFSELPADTAIRLLPGESYATVQQIPDPAVTPLPGERIPLLQGKPVPLRGKTKIRVGYFCGAAEWLAYRKDVTSIGRSEKRSGLPVKLKFVDSEEFEIPPVKP
jgi:hypothetical protein